MKTPEEAKKCWCPFARESATYTVEGFGYSYNRTFGREDKARCIASECMAWRWEGDIFDTIAKKMVPMGYCGLAGKP